MIDQDFSQKDFLELLAGYQPLLPVEGLFRDHVRQFVQSFKESAFVRDNEAGHITASAFVVDEDMEKMLLMHHKKLGFWVQFGGHADGDMNVIRVAKRELEEESGIINPKIYSDHIFDIDIHRIPQIGNEPVHLHYDIRFLFQMPIDVACKLKEDEVDEMRWFSFDEVAGLEESALERVCEKIFAVREGKYLV